MHPDSLTASGSELSPKNSTLYCFLNGSSLPEVQVLLIKTQNKKSHYRGTSCFGAVSDVKSEPKAEFSISSKVIVSVPSL